MAKETIHYIDLITKEYKETREIDTKFFGKNIPNTTNAELPSEKDGYIRILDGNSFVQLEVPTVYVFNETTQVYENTHKDTFLVAFKKWALKENETLVALPSNLESGKAWCFDKTSETWIAKSNHIGKTVYHTQTKEPFVVDYAGEIKNDFTLLVPKEFDVWDEATKAWKEDAVAKGEYEEQQAKIEKAQELSTLTITNNTVLYDAHQEAIGNMAAIIGIANATYIRAVSVGLVLEGETEAVVMTPADAYNYVYKQTVNWKGADDKWHTVQLESLVETTQKAMTEKATVLSKY